MTEDEQREYEEYLEAKDLLLEQMKHIGLMSIKFGHSLDDNEVITTGNILAICSSIIKGGDDIFEFEGFLKFYSAKKIMETLTLKDIFDLRDRKLGKESTDKILDDLDITREDLNNDKGFDFDSYLPNEEDDDDD